MFSFNKTSFKKVNLIILSTFLLIFALFNFSVHAEETRVVEHAMGETEITGTPQKIVVLYQGATDSLLAFDKKPVGAVESWIQKPWYKYIRSEMEGVVNVGSETQPNLEKIMDLNPDLIIGSKLRHEKIYNKLSAIAPTVMSETVYEWKKTVDLIGRSINKEGKANNIIKSWNESAEQFKEKIGAEINSEISIVRFMTDHARIYYKGFAGSILEDIGLKRPKNQRQDKWGIKLTSKESIPNMNGDVIFDITDDYSGDKASFKTREKWQNHPLWSNLKAAKKGNVYQVDSVIWNMGGGAIAAEKLLNDLYKYFEVN